MKMTPFTRGFFGEVLDAIAHAQLAGRTPTGLRMSWETRDLVCREMGMTPFHTMPGLKIAQLPVVIDDSVTYRHAMIDLEPEAPHDD